MNLYTKFGNIAPATQRVDYIENGSRFVSYDTVIAEIKFGALTLDKNYWDYSATTGFYRNQFLGEGVAETRKKIKSGVYKLGDLNATI